MKAIYWSTTIPLMTFLCWSAYTYIFSQSTIEAIKELGLPDYMRVELAVLKVVGVLIILIPQVSLQVKEWAYAGVGLFFVTAIIAHAVHKDPIIINLINVVLIGLLITSYIYMHKLESAL
jgi:hypothetical protein